MSFKLQTRGRQTRARKASRITSHPKVTVIKKSHYWNRRHASAFTHGPAPCARRSCCLSIVLACACTISLMSTKASFKTSFSCLRTMAFWRSVRPLSGACSLSPPILCNLVTWAKMTRWAIWGWFLLRTMIPVRSQWGHYNSHRSSVCACICMYNSIIYSSPAAPQGSSQTDETAMSAHLSGENGARSVFFSGKSMGNHWDTNG